MLTGSAPNLGALKSSSRPILSIRRLNEGDPDLDFEKARDCEPNLMFAASIRQYEVP